MEKWRREYDKQRWKNMSNEDRETRNARRREQYLKQSSEKREKVLANARQQRSNMTPEQKKARSTRTVQYYNELNPERYKDIRRKKLIPPSKYAGRDPNNLPPELFLGKRDKQCDFCEAYHFAWEQTARKTFSSCCGGGIIKLKDLTKYPKELQSLLCKGDDVGRNFRTNIRKYNSAFAFASFDYQPPKGLRAGPPVFIIHGQVYHHTQTTVDSGSPSSSTYKPSYSELYFLDPEFANHCRLQNDHNANLKYETVLMIDTLLRQINPYAEAFKMMREVITANSNSLSKIEMWITKDRQHDPRRYNLPVANEVAAVFVSEDGEPPFKRDIAVHPIGKQKLQDIHYTSPNCTPMIYPLLFPHGDFGWQRGIQKVKKIRSQDNDSGTFNEQKDAESGNQNVSLLEFCSYRLQDRPEFSPLLHAGKLTQQLIVDWFLQVEGQRIDWNKQNQKKLRVDLYLGLMDYVNSLAEQKELRTGRIVILPSSFNGGKRAMQQNYQDAMILVAKFGKPDLFITFTCNPKWKEIQAELKEFVNPRTGKVERENPIDRPDLVSTVFYLKLKQLFNDLTCDKGGVLGKVKAFIYVIEFQKRGLPHCHMLLILDEKDKLREPADVDSIVCAEIPDKDKEPNLYEVITSCMIHGPCGDHNKKSPCMEDIKGIWTCSKNFPKDFVEETNVNVNGYPLYRRRNNNNIVFIKEKPVDNRWVVPYNPYLSSKYNAHINVEVCSSVQSVKYIFKYIYKGHDAAIVQVSDASGTYHWDEVETYLNTRYLAAPEAMWRLRKYEMSGRSHAVERLPIHLPHQQDVYFAEGEEQKSLEEAERKGTKLTKWFYLNQTDPEARQYMYTEIPFHYVWVNNFWQKRKRGGNKILPRMYSVSPRDMERFSLRLLLMHTRGATSFETLRSFEGVQYECFLDTAKAMGLLEDDSEWERTMTEASVFQMPRELRLLFATILVNAHPTNSKELYYQFREAMMEDYIQTFNVFMAEQHALANIQHHLMQFGETCQNFGLPIPVNVVESEEIVDIEAAKIEAEQLILNMNSGQLSAFNTIMDAVNGNTKQKCFFLSGAGGYGKTYVYRALIAKVLGENGLVKSVAPTGLAATLLKGGKTVHSGFGISIHLNDRTTSHFTPGMSAWKEIKKTKLIIWDEISMCHAHLLNAVERSLRFIRESDDPFGGIVIVVGGDFRQQAPVVQHGNRVQIVESCVKSSSLWHHFQELQLTQNMRVKHDEVDFSNWLLSVGSGLDENGANSNLVKLKDDILSSDIVATVFGSDINVLPPDDLAARAVLCPKNCDTLVINEKVLSMLSGIRKVYYSVDKVGECETDKECEQYPIEFINSLTPMGLPPHVLNLKKGCCVMLLRNLNPKRGLCNGTRLIVESMRTNLIECSIFSGDRKGEKVLIPRIPMDSGNNSDLPFKLSRKQFPIRLAYSMTITKSQGQTFDKIGLYLPETVFTHGQLYTAFSRVRSEKGLSVQIHENSSQGKIFEEDDQNYTYNCVYREILN